ncbi:MAG TPA: OsmC family protein [Polyangia bacterium]|nr:OsmC family protein [Polyangia bacterium]
MKIVELKALFERKARAMARRPVFGRGTAQARIQLGDGLACDVEHPERKLLVDQPVSEGGGGAGPPPDELMRASIGASLAMGYRLWGARLGVAIDAVEVEMTCEYDVRGQLGVADDVTAGWQSVRFDVAITSAAPEAAIRHVVETADRRCPMLANLALSVRRVHHLSIVRAGVRATERAVPSDITPLGS